MNASTFSSALAVLLVAGCTSISSTMLNRTDSDMFLGNSNGSPQHGDQTRPFKGVPITVRVPTHVDVVIREEVLFRLAAQGVCRIARPQPSYDVMVTPVYTDKVFTVDLKRPAAGSLNYTLDFGEGENSQYFKTLNSTIDDQTLEDINAAIQTIVQATTASTVASPPAKTEFLQTEYRTVAWKRFDLDTPDLENQIACFVSQRLNPGHLSPIASTPAAF